MEKSKNETIFYAPDEVLLSPDDAYEELDENINKQLSDIDFSSLDDILNSLPNTVRSIFNGEGFLKLVKKFISAEDSDLYNNFLPYFLSIIFDNVLGFVPYFAVIIVLAVICSLVGQVSGDKNKSLSTLLHIILFSTISIIVLKLVIELLFSVKNATSLIESQMEIIFPILLTLITAIGNTVTATTFEPLLAILSNGISKLFVTILIPIFIFSIVFGVIGNLSKNVKLDKFSKFFSSLFNWMVGIVFTVFIAFLTLHGLTVSTIDSISFRTAKFAIKNYIPLLGSYLSDGMSVILASSVLIKNAIGVSGLVLLFATIFSPIIKIVVVMLLLKLTCAILEPLCEGSLVNFMYSVSKSLNMLVISLLAIGFMYLISVSLLMSFSNIL